MIKELSPTENMKAHYLQLVAAEIKRLRGLGVPEIEGWTLDSDLCVVPSPHVIDGAPAHDQEQGWKISKLTNGNFFLDFCVIDPICLFTFDSLNQALSRGPADYHSVDRVMISSMVPVEMIQVLAMAEGTEQPTVSLSVEIDAQTGEVVTSLLRLAIFKNLKAVFYNEFDARLDQNTTSFVDQEYVYAWELAKLLIRQSSRNHDSVDRIRPDERGRETTRVISEFVSRIFAEYCLGKNLPVVYTNRLGPDQSEQIEDGKLMSPLQVFEWTESKGYYHSLVTGHRVRWTAPLRGARSLFNIWQVHASLEQEAGLNLSSDVKLLLAMFVAATSNRRRELKRAERRFDDEVITVETIQEEVTKKVNSNLPLVSINLWQKIVAFWDSEDFYAMRNMVIEYVDQTRESNVLSGFLNKVFSEITYQGSQINSGTDQKLWMVTAEVEVDGHTFTAQAISIKKKQAQKLARVDIFLELLRGDEGCTEYVRNRFLSYRLNHKN